MSTARFKIDLKLLVMQDCLVLAKQTIEVVQLEPTDAMLEEAIYWLDGILAIEYADLYKIFKSRKLDFWERCYRFDSQLPEMRLLDPLLKKFKEAVRMSKRPKLFRKERKHVRTRFPAGKEQDLGSKPARSRRAQN